MKFKQHSAILTGLILGLLTVSCISKTIDVSNDALYHDLIGKTFKTKVTCRLNIIDGNEYIVAKYIAKRDEDGKLIYQKGSIPGKDYILDGSVFTVIKVIRKQSFEYDFLEVIGDFKSVKKTIDVGFLFKSVVGGKIIPYDEFLEEVE